MNTDDAVKIANRMIDPNAPKGGLALIFSEREAIRGLLEAIEHYREVIAAMACQPSAVDSE